MTDAGDSAQIRKAVAGDAEALSALLREHGPAVERALRVDPLWQSSLEAADVMQVTYLEAFFQISSFNVDGDATFATWLRRIAENNLKDAIRGLNRQKRPPARNRINVPNHADSMIGLFDLLGVVSATPSRQVGRQELVSLLEDAIAALPEDYARVIRMYDIEGSPIAEVAAAMGRSTGAVHMLRARAHDQLREKLGASSIFFDSHGA